MFGFHFIFPILKSITICAYMSVVLHSWVNAIKFVVYTIYTLYQDFVFDRMYLMACLYQTILLLIMKTKTNNAKDVQCTHNKN